MLSTLAAEISWSIAFVVVTVAVGLKLFTRIKFLRGLFIDDYLIMTAWVLFCLGLSTIYVMLHNGLQHPQLFWIFYPVEKREKLLMYFYISVQFYTIGTLFSKLSLIYLYKRITRGALTLLNVDRFLTYLAVVCVAFSVLGLGMDGFWCKPLHAFWTDPLNPDKCSAKLQRITIYLFSSFNIASDIAIMLVPYFFLSQAALRHKTQRYGLYALFGVGIFVIVTTMMKIIAIAKNFEISSLVLWSYIEACTSITVASVPSLPPLLSRIMARTGSSGASGPRSRSGHEMIPEAAMSRQNTRVQGVKEGGSISVENLV